MSYDPGLTDGIHPTLAVLAERDLAGPWWIACQFPERPPDGWVAFAFDCPKCMIAMEAGSRLHPNLTLHHYQHDAAWDNEPLLHTYAQGVEMARGRE